MAAPSARREGGRKQGGFLVRNIGNGLHPLVESRAQEVNITCIVDFEDGRQAKIFGREDFSPGSGFKRVENALGALGNFEIGDFFAAIEDFKGRVMLVVGRQQAIYRNQTGAMIISLIIPYGVSMATTYGLIPLPYYDLTPSMLTLSCIVIAYSFFRFQFLRVVPLARDIIFEQMADGVFVLDKHHKLVDLNPAALEIINLRIGETAHNILAQIKPGQMPESDSQAQITIGQGEDQRQYHARITAVRDEDSNLLGWAMLLRDNTENLRLMEQLQYMATIDAVTDVCNRRYLMQILNDEWARARRYDSMMALVMMDLDNFKLVNDTHGHLAGDAVLKEVAQICKRNLRDVDRIGRFGGEEFTMLLPETDLHGARITAERLRRLIAEKIVFYHGVEIRVTASFGVAELPPDKEATSITRFLKAADDALYVAKRAGRNRVAALDDIEPPGTGIQG